MNPTLNPLTEEEKAKLMIDLKAFRDLVKSTVVEVISDVAPNDVDDVVNNIYLRAYSELDQENVQANLDFWFVRFVVKESLSARREKSGLVDVAAKDAHMIDSKQTPRISYATSEEVELAEKVVQSLPTKYRDAFSFDKTKVHPLNKLKDSIKKKLSK